MEIIGSVGKSTQLYILLIDAVLLDCFLFAAKNVKFKSIVGQIKEIFVPSMN